MSDLPAAQENAAGAAIVTAGTTYYLSLHTADPGTTGASEVTGGSYVRKAIVFNTWASGATASNAAIAFTGMPSESGNLWIGIWTASTAGTFLWGSPTAAVTGPVAAGATVNFASGAVTASVA